MRDELRAATQTLQERLARLPLVKTWTDTVHYCGDVVVHDGNVWQAKQNTGKAPDHADWILLARSGRDGRDGDTPRLRGRFDAHKTYAQFDLIEYDGNSYIACHDAPGVPGIDDGWQLLSARGSRGPVGDTGPAGKKGERGARGEDAPTIISWTLDPVHYRAVPTMSDETAGPALDLRPLFEQFCLEALAEPR